jgi:hypothetical protein
VSRLAFSAALAMGALLSASGACAQTGNVPLAHLGDSTESVQGRGMEVPASGDFDGLGTPGRLTSIQSDTAFSTTRVLTERLELAHAFPFVLSPQYVNIVARINVAADADTTAGTYNALGPIGSLGIRIRSPSNNYWFELGVRLVPSWPGPNDNLPSTLQLALNATLAGGLADDARWLPFNTMGYQLYGAVQSRAQVARTPVETIFLGSIFGGETSLPPLSVTSWLGPQQGVIGNAFVEVFVSAPRLLDTTLNLQLGVHGEVSLSSIWPGNDPLPMHGDVYLGWSPVTSFALRLFGGFSGSPSSSASVPAGRPYGLRLEYFIP